MVKIELKAVALASTILIASIAEADSSAPLESPTYLSGEKVKQGQLLGGYNEKASYSCKDGSDFFVTGNYIYWTWQQEMMEVGTLITPTAFGALAFLNGSGEVILQSPGYSSGFQLGLGYGLKEMDDWLIHGEYTWYKNSDTLQSFASSSEILAVSSSLIPYIQGVGTGVLLADQLTTKARLHYNAADLLLQRPFYFGRKLTADLKLGLEALWIDQKFTATGSDLSFVGAGAFVATPLDGSFNSTTKQKSWGLGPKFGLTSNWLFGYGIKIMGSASISALYTRYTTLSTSVNGSVSATSSAHLHTNQKKNYNTVNPIAEAFLGLGWGSYFCNDRIHFELSAGYDFKLFWNQNVVTTLVNSNGSPGNLSLQGLNIRARFDF
jgi:hypothetical protein